MKPLYYRSVSSKGAGRPRLSHHYKGWWNETKWMRWVCRNGGMKFVVGENGRNPMKNLPRPHFVHHETHMEWPRRELGTPAVEVECLTLLAPLRPLILVTYTNHNRKEAICILIYSYENFPLSEFKYRTSNFWTSSVVYFWNYCILMAMLWLPCKWS